MPKLYCGKFSEPPKGRLIGTSNACGSRHWRLYGKKMIDHLSNEHQRLAETLLTYTSSTANYCGHKNTRPHGRCVMCKKRVARYGVFPYVETSDDIEFRTFHPDIDDKMPGNIDESFTGHHGYVYDLYAKRSVHRDRNNILLVVAFAKSLTEKQRNEIFETNIFTSKGVIGYAFGYFSMQSVFEIVRIFVNYPYRSTSSSKSNMALYILQNLRDEVVAKTKHIRGQKMMRIDQGGPCFQLFNGANNAESKRLANLYTEAGFEIERFSTERANSIRRTAVFHYIS